MSDHNATERATSGQHPDDVQSESPDVETSSHDQSADAIPGNKRPVAGTQRDIAIGDGGLDLLEQTA